jgi:hypothetical protein
MVMSLYNMMRTGSNFDSWLTTDTEAERLEAAADDIRERTNDLLKEPDFDCTLFENFSQDVYSATAEQAESVQEYLRTRDFEKLGRLLWSISYESRLTMAQDQATKDWENE